MLPSPFIGGKSGYGQKKWRYGENCLNLHREGLAGPKSIQAFSEGFARPGPVRICPRYEAQSLYALEEPAPSWPAKETTGFFCSLQFQNHGGVSDLGLMHPKHIRCRSVFAKAEFAVKLLCGLVSFENK